MTRLRETIGLVVLAIALAAGPAPAQSLKPSHLLSYVQKSRLSPEDRELAAEYLTANAADLPGAPAEAEWALRASGVWSSDLDRYARPLPRKLERVLSPPAEGTTRLIFNRSLLLVRNEDRSVLDRVFPR